MRNFIAIADSWGSKFGGINTFNFELCKALAKNPDSRIVCALPHKSDGYTLLDNVHVLGIYSKQESRFHEGWENCLRQELNKIEMDISDFDFVIGHDVITGSEAISLANNEENLKSLIFNHQAYKLYESMKNNDGELALEKDLRQTMLFKESNVLLCVGPLLYRYFSKKHELNSLDKENRIIEFIPGLPEIQPSQAELTDFSLMTLGRFDKNHDLKGVNITKDGYALAVKEAREVFGKNPQLNIFGITDEKQAVEFINETQFKSESFITVNLSKFNTNREELFFHMRDSSCVTMLSMIEGFGLVGWEAIACEIPILLSENSGLFYLLEQNRLENLVTSVKLNNNVNDKELVKEKLKEIAFNKTNSKIDAIGLHELLKEKYTWDKVITDLMEKLTGIYPNNQNSQATNVKRVKISNSTAEDIIWEFYNGMRNHDFKKSWEFLSSSFKKRRWKDYDHFEKGFSNFVGIENLKVFESTYTYSTKEFHVIFDEQREVPNKPLIDDVKFHTYSQRNDLIKKLEELKGKLVNEFGCAPKQIEDLELAKFFNKGTEDYLMFELNLYDKIPRQKRKLRRIPRYFSILCAYQENSYKIDRILPIRYAERD